jgi:antitoxin component of MazEF toxin-antitoxin module
MATQLCKVERDGVIRIPLKILKLVGFEPGEEIMMEPQEDRLVLAKRGSIVDKLEGRLEVEQELALEIMESQELEI